MISIEREGGYMLWEEADSAGIHVSTTVHSGRQQVTATGPLANRTESRRRIRASQEPYPR